MQKGKDTKEVTDFIEKIDHPLQKGAVLLREVILSADKGITVHIKWNALSFCIDGDDRITMNSAARIIKDNRLDLMFHRGAKKKDTKGFDFKNDAGLFKWLAPDRAIVSFTSAKDIEAHKAKLKKIVKE